MLEDLSQPKSKTNSARAQHPATKAVSKATVRRGVVASSSDEEDSAPAPPAKRGLHLQYGMIGLQEQQNTFVCTDYQRLYRLHVLYCMQCSSMH